jgi:hypothetical protein
MVSKIILLTLLGLGLLMSMIKHGENKGNYDMRYTLLAIIIELLLLYNAEFFKGLMY